MKGTAQRHIAPGKVRLTPRSACVLSTPSPGLDTVVIRKKHISFACYIGHHGTAHVLKPCSELLWF